MTDELVERLRIKDRVQPERYGILPDDLYRLAADRIQSLTANNAALREAGVSAVHGAISEDDAEAIYRDMRHIAMSRDVVERVAKALRDDEVAWREEMGLEPAPKHWKLFERPARAIASLLGNRTF